jgi:hypothetical protein
MLRYLQQLVRCTVSEIRPMGGGYMKIVFRSPAGEVYECELLSDEEGNQPGFLSGLPMPRPSVYERWNQIVEAQKPLTEGELKRLEKGED